MFRLSKKWWPAPTWRTDAGHHGGIQDKMLA
jgi:hypothetical protein